jgi:16S rRNA G1207 methylase RsmC
VFSAGGIDPGTKFLLLEAPTRPAPGTCSTWGAGTGRSRLTLARRAPGGQVWGVDVNERAIGLCTRNAESAGITNVTAVTAAAGIPGDIVLDAIYSNPPIRIGKPALHDLLLTWLPRLRPDGHAYLVVQKTSAPTRWPGGSATRDGRPPGSAPGPAGCSSVTRSPDPDAGTGADPTGASDVATSPAPS